jgi:hypothetical protein
MPACPSGLGLDSRARIPIHMPTVTHILTMDMLILTGAGQVFTGTAAIGFFGRIRGGAHASGTGDNKRQTTFSQAGG